MEDSEFVSQVGAVLKEFSFVRTTGARGRGLAVFSRPTSWSHEFLEYVSIDALIHRDRRLDVTVELGIESSLLAYFEYEVQLCKCDPWWSDNGSLPSALPLMSMDFSDWLGENGIEKRSWIVRHPSETSEVDVLLSQLADAGARFFGRFQSLPDVENVFLSEDVESPLYLADRASYLAIAIWSIGGYDRGVKLLRDILSGKYPPRLAADVERDSAVREIVRCRAEKVLRYFRECRERSGSV